MILRFFCLLITFALISGCRHRGKDDATGVFRYNEPANISSLDPAFSRDQASIWGVNQLFNGLVQLDNNLQVLPCISSKWEISGDGLQYTFHLRRDVKFHNDPCFPGGQGRTVTAHDFVFSFERIIDPAVASPGAWIFNLAENRADQPAFQAPDDSTLIIHLKQPFPPFTGLLAMPYCSVVPEEALNMYGLNFRSHPVGTGPFLFRMWKEGVKLVLLKNPEYFEFEGTTRLPYMDAVSVTFLADRQAAFLEFIKGKLDFLSGLDPSYKDELLTRSGELKPVWHGKIKLISQPYLNTEYLGILMDVSAGQLKDNPLALRELRQALNYCFDRRKMIRYLRNGIGTPGLHGIIPKGMPGFDPTRIYYDYNPDTARYLLAHAGFPGGKGLKPLTLVSTPDYLDICKYIQHEAAALGIEMLIEISPPAAVKELKAQGKLPFFRASWIADYPDAENYLSLFYSPNFCPKGPNYTHFINPEYDELYLRSLSVTVDSIRFNLYRRMEEIMMTESPVIILYYDKVLRFTRQNVEGIGSNPMNLLTLKKVRKN